MGIEEPGFYRRVEALLERNEPFATATIVKVGGSIPNDIGAKILVDANGERLAGTVGGGRIEFDTIAACRDAIHEGKSRLIHAKLTDREAGGIGMMCGGHADIFIDVHIPAPHLVLCGAGHINLALHRMTAGLGWRVTVIDDRADWASPANYPGATIIDARPEAVLQELGLTPTSFVVIGTRDGDLHAILAAAKTSTGYIGVVASKRKAILLAREVAALGGNDFDFEALLPRLHAPVGLQLGGRSPEAVALSILSEIQAVRYKVTPQPMRIAPEELACHVARKSPQS